MMPSHTIKDGGKAEEGWETRNWAERRFVCGRGAEGDYHPCKRCIYELELEGEREENMRHERHTSTLTRHTQEKMQPLDLHFYFQVT